MSLYGFDAASVYLDSFIRVILLSLEFEET